MTKNNQFHFRQIDIQDLKNVVNNVLDHIINDLKIKNISIEDEKDFYWDIPTEKLFSVKEAQPQMGIGRLSDDWDLLLSTLEDPKNAVSLSLIHVAPLLRWIGEKI